MDDRYGYRDAPVSPAEPGGSRAASGTGEDLPPLPPPPPVGAALPERVPDPDGSQDPFELPAPPGPGALWPSTTDIDGAAEPAPRGWSDPQPVPTQGAVGRVSVPHAAPPSATELPQPRPAATMYRSGEPASAFELVPPPPLTPFPSGLRFPPTPSDPAPPVPLAPGQQTSPDAPAFGGGPPTYGRHEVAPDGLAQPADTPLPAPVNEAAPLPGRHDLAPPPGTPRPAGPDEAVAPLPGRFELPPRALAQPAIPIPATSDDAAPLR
ncbi:MAG TPA: hypothetical protein VJT31_06035, partial [Rugosimonospora sp.]|nr:hypothetical protein [Rugosimonospora sp.]